MFQLPSRAQAFVSSSPVPLTLADSSEPDCPLIYVNAAFEQLTGYSADRMIGRNCRFLQGNVEQPVPRADIRDAIEQNTDTQVILKNFTADGTSYDVLLFIYGLVMGKDSPIMMGSQFKLTSNTDPARIAEYTERVDAAAIELDRLRIATYRTTSDSAMQLVKSYVQHFN